MEKEWKLLVLALVVGLLAGFIGGVLSAQLFIKPGPQRGTGTTRGTRATGHTRSKWNRCNFANN